MEKKAAWWQNRTEIENLDWVDSFFFGGRPNIYWERKWMMLPVGHIIPDGSTELPWSIGGYHLRNPMVGGVWTGGWLGKSWHPSEHRYGYIRMPKLWAWDGIWDVSSSWIPRQEVKEFGVGCGRDGVGKFIWTISYYTQWKINAALK